MAARRPATAVRCALEDELSPVLVGRVPVLVEDAELEELESESESSAPSPYNRIALRCEERDPSTRKIEEVDTRKTYAESVERLGGRLVYIDAANAALGAGRVVEEPDRRVRGDRNLEVGNRRAVVRGAVARVEAVDRGIRLVRGNAGRGELGLNHAVRAIGDCKILWSARFYYTLSTSVACQ